MSLKKVSPSRRCSARSIVRLQIPKISIHPLVSKSTQETVTDYIAPTMPESLPSNIRLSPITVEIDHPEIPTILVDSESQSNSKSTPKIVLIPSPLRVSRKKKRLEQQKEKVVQHFCSMCDKQYDDEPQMQEKCHSWKSRAFKVLCEHFNLVELFETLNYTGELSFALDALKMCSPCQELTDNLVSLNDTINDLFKKLNTAAFAIRDIIATSSSIKNEPDLTDITDKGTAYIRNFKFAAIQTDYFRDDGVVYSFTENSENKVIVQSAACPDECQVLVDHLNAHETKQMEDDDEIDFALIETVSSLNIKAPQQANNIAIAPQLCPTESVHPIELEDFNSISPSPAFSPLSIHEEEIEIISQFSQDDYPPPDPDVNLDGGTKRKYRSKGSQKSSRSNRKRKNNGIMAEKRKSQAKKTFTISKRPKRSRTLIERKSNKHSGDHLPKWDVEGYNVMRGMGIPFKRLEIPLIRVSTIDSCIHPSTKTRDKRKRPLSFKLPAEMKWQTSPNRSAGFVDVDSQMSPISAISTMILELQQEDHQINPAQCINNKTSELPPENESPPYDFVDFQGSPTSTLTLQSKNENDNISVSFNTSPEKFTVIETKGGEFVCSGCKQSFKNQNGAQMHIEYIHNEDRRKKILKRLELKNETFKSVNDLHQHHPESEIEMSQSSPTPSLPVLFREDIEKANPITSYLRINYYESEGYVNNDSLPILIPFYDESA